jgi:DNA mismatch endonuclease, patch repair protein
MLRGALHRAGYRFRKNVRGIFGNPDIVFPREKVAVFVDGDFWHARVLKERGMTALRHSLKTSNREFWIAKLGRNYERDRAVTAELERLGWLVLRLWENDLKRQVGVGIKTVVAAIEARRSEIAFDRN